jgi:putative GTP pyrophosphokinase
VKPNEQTSPDRAKSLDLRAYISRFRELEHELKIFMVTVDRWFSEHPDMMAGRPPLIHSVKSRLKNVDHLREKIRRKYVRDGQVIFPPERLSDTVTDLSGVRVMHLHQKQFTEIRHLLEKKISTGDWFLAETKAFTWDPESAAYFRKLGIEPELRDTFYTSVHFVVRPSPNSPLVCEIQTRTLFEEIWGEVDHALNYPKVATLRSHHEQLRVLSKLVGAGSRLLDSIFIDSSGLVDPGGRTKIRLTRRK